ncbi:hypothetical protein AVEN_127911-1 [Araneus ventricosus]|uniref:MULE transposase domain-containing protein n=1 Tax=Araneus ventricosus TaxID=182803 RepID=A0A4Y1ZYS6_ARAVE|nr:hypothetical protein AVEN_127911-1 [Araneus ventricosus]
MIQKLKEKIPTYPEEGITVQMNEDPFAVLILTPLMIYAHGIQECENIVFVDSTSSCDSESHCITLMLKPCAAGSTPIAILITKGETENLYGWVQFAERNSKNLFQWERSSKYFFDWQIFS